MSKLRQGLPIGEYLAMASMGNTAPNDDIARIMPSP